MEAYATLARPARSIVLDPVSFKVRNRAVIAFDRHIDDQNAFWPLQCFNPARQRSQMRRYAIDLLQINTPCADVMRSQIRRNFMLDRHAVTTPNFKYCVISNLAVLNFGTTSAADSMPCMFAITPDRYAIAASALSSPDDGEAETSSGLACCRAHICAYAPPA